MIRSAPGEGIETGSQKLLSAASRPSEGDVQATAPRPWLSSGSCQPETRSLFLGSLFLLVALVDGVRAQAGGDAALTALLDCPRPREVALDVSGRHLAYTVLMPGGPQGPGASLFVRSPGDEAPRRLVAPTLGASGLAFDPEGKWIWFLSSGETPQVCRVATAGGALEVVTALPRGVTAFRLGPVGLRLAVLPRSDDGAAPLLILSTKKGRELARQRGGARIREFEWFPDGTRLACLADAGPAGGTEALRHELVILSSAGGAPVSRHGPLIGRATGPLITADGTQIVLRVSGGQGREPRAGRLLVVPVEESGAAPIRHFENAPFTVIGHGRIGEGNLCYALAVHGFETRLHVVDPLKGPRGELSLGRRALRVRQVAMAGDGRAYAFVGDDPVRGGLVGRADVGAPHEDVVASFTPKAAGALLAPERLRWTGAGGGHLEGELLRPAVSSAKPPPVVVVLSGFDERLPPGFLPEDGRDMARVLATQGLAVFRPQLPGGGSRGVDFATRTRGRIGDLELAALGGALALLKESPLVDADRLGIAGWGQGGTLALLAAAREGVRARAVAAVGAPTHWMALIGSTATPETLSWFRLGEGPFSDREAWWRRSPLAHAEQLGLPVLLAHGAKDRVVPPAQSRALHRRLRELGGRAELFLVAGADGRFAARQHQEELALRLAMHFTRHLGLR